MCHFHHVLQSVLAAELGGVRACREEKVIEPLDRRHAPIAHRVDELSSHPISGGQEAVFVDELIRMDEAARLVPLFELEMGDRLHKPGECQGVGDCV